LLQGLIVCACCGYAYYGKPISPSARKGHERFYAYYRCIGSNAYRFGGLRLCWNKQLRTALFDEAVWKEVCRLLEEPERLAQEYRKRLLPKEGPSELDGIEGQLGRLGQGLIDKTEFEPRITRMRERIKQLEEHQKQLRDEAGLEQGLRLILGRLEDFTSRVKEGLYSADWSTRREIIHALVKRVEIDQEQVRVVFCVDPNVPSSSPTDKNTQSLQDCGSVMIASTMVQFRSRIELSILMRAVLILNPTSGISTVTEKRMSVEETEKAILQGLQASGIEPDVSYTAPEFTGNGLATRAAAEDIELVIAVGGDGTIHAVANGLVGTQSTLGIIPIGMMK
jgi:hypothetical protein